jgi:hypothetical protein
MCGGVPQAVGPETKNCTPPKKIERKKEVIVTSLSCSDFKSFTFSQESHHGIQLHVEHPASVLVMCGKRTENWVGQQDVVSRLYLETVKMLLKMGEEEQFRTGHRDTSLGALISHFRVHSPSPTAAGSLSPSRAGQEAAQAMVGLIVGKDRGPTKFTLLDRLIPVVATAVLAALQFTLWPPYSVFT